MKRSYPPFDVNLPPVLSKLFLLVPYGDKFVKEPYVIIKSRKIEVIVLGSPRLI